MLIVMFFLVFRKAFVTPCLHVHCVRVNVVSDMPESLMPVVMPIKSHDSPVTCFFNQSLILNGKSYEENSLFTVEFPITSKCDIAIVLFEHRVKM